MALSPPLRLDPPLGAAPVDDDGQHTRLWALHFQQVADRLHDVTIGVTDGSDAAAGSIGEFMTATSGAVGLTSGTVANVVPLTLTPGDWEVSGLVSFSATAGTSHTSFGAGLDAIGILNQSTFPAGAMTQGIGVPPKRYNVTASTVVNLVANAAFSGGTVTAQGVVNARRTR